MKRIILPLVACALAARVLALEVDHLRTQACTNPIGVDVETPSFSWMLSSADRGIVQKSYNIRVSTDRDFHDIVWESGEVRSDRSADVPAAGFTTRPRTRYYWQVTVTDNTGATATSSERAYFETGRRLGVGRHKMDKGVRRRGRRRHASDRL